MQTSERMLSFTLEQLLLGSQTYIGSAAVSGGLIPALCLCSWAAQDLP